MSELFDAKKMPGRVERGDDAGKSKEFRSGDVCSREVNVRNWLQADLYREVWERPLTDQKRTSANCRSHVRF